MFEVWDWGEKLLKRNECGGEKDWLLKVVEGEEIELKKLRP